MAKLRAVLVLALIAMTSPALGAGFEARSSREPLPAREVERPIVLPTGWTGLSAVSRFDTENREVYQFVDSLGIRRGLMPGHELWITLATGSTVIHPNMGWRWSLYRAEPPSTALAIETQWSDPGVVQSGIAVRRQVGALRLTARAAGQYKYLEDKAAGLGSVEALLQVGFLALVAKPRVIVEDREATSDVRLRGVAQWSRGFDTALLIDVPISGGGVVRVMGLQVRSRF